MTKFDEIRQDQPEVIMCRFHFDKGDRHEATHVAPRHVGGDVDQPAEWIPVCRALVDHWHDCTEDWEKLPIFTLTDSEEAGGE